MGCSSIILSGSSRNTSVLRRPTAASDRSSSRTLEPGVVAVIQIFVDRIIDHLKLTFVTEKPPPSHVIEQVALTRPPREGLRNAALMAAEEGAEVLSLVLDIDPRQE
jgi:hypothetical protein